MKTQLRSAAVICIITFAACKKDHVNSTIPPLSQETNNYSSVGDFFAQNAVPMQTFTIHGSTGGSFTTPQGTTVSIPANAFVNHNNVTVSGNVTIQFKDIYKKSDMLMSDRPTITINWEPLRSAGEFYIKAISGNEAVNIAAGKKISVSQPIQLTGGLDSAMIPFIVLPDSLVNQGGNLGGWSDAPYDTLLYSASNYIFGLYYFSSPVDSGTWGNSDNPSFFSSFSQTHLILHPYDDPANFQTDVFLVFKNVNSMVHVYRSGPDFSYWYAPQGLQCTLVAIGVKGGKLYSSFVPVTIAANQTVNFSLTETTTNDFKTQLKTLD